MIPKKGDKVKLLDQCHKRLLNKIVEVVNVTQENDEYWLHARYRKDGDWIHTSGKMGNVQIVSQDQEIYHEASNNLVRFMQLLKDKAKEIAPEYPSIENANMFESLWAITSSYEGTNKAVDDWKDFSMFLLKKLNLDLKTAWNDFKNSKPKIQKAVFTINPNYIGNIPINEFSKTLTERTHYDWPNTDVIIKYLPISDASVAVTLNDDDNPLPYENILKEYVTEVLNILKPSYQ